MKYILLVMLSIVVTGCDVFEDIFGDCINLDGPQFYETTIPSAVLNEIYDVTINAYIKNSSQDSYYNYSISFEGALPRGITIYRDENDRTIQLTGTPTETGVFVFTLTVNVTAPDNYYNPPDNSYDDGNDLCYTTHEEEYTLVVSSI